MYDQFINLVQNFYNRDRVGLHEPHFDQSEINKLTECIESGFVSSVGKFVDEFETQFASYVGSSYAVAVVNGTCGIQAALTATGVRPGDKVIVPNITFIATSNAVRHAGATPIYLDIESQNLGLCPTQLRSFFTDHCELKNGSLIEKSSGAKVSACLPVHIFGNPCLIEKIATTCAEFNVICIEDAAEALGSYIGDQHIGQIGDVSIFSFNGNKVMTTGGGGMIVTSDESLAKKLKHLTTTARVADGYNFVHDDIGYNFRMPNLNAALGLAQMEKLDHLLNRKNELRSRYKAFFLEQDMQLLETRPETRSNHWLNAVLLKDRSLRDEFLEKTNAAGIMTRPLWMPMSEMPMNKDGLFSEYPISHDFFNRVVCLPSGPY